MNKTIAKKKQIPGFHQPSLGDNVTSILGSVVNARADTATASIKAVGGQQSGARSTQVKCC
jgi:hypothetical protein